jgi:hypothetical protein
MANRPPQLPKATRPLTGVHRQLLQLVAEAMVDEYLQEVEEGRSKAAGPDDEAVQA